MPTFKVTLLREVVRVESLELEVQAPTAYRARLAGLQLANSVPPSNHIAQVWLTREPGEWFTVPSDPKLIEE